MNQETGQMMSKRFKVWKLDIAHDRHVTAESALGDAVEALGDLCESGDIAPELHDAVYDLHKQARKFKRKLNKARIEARKEPDDLVGPLSKGLDAAYAKPLNELNGD